MTLPAPYFDGADDPSESDSENESSASFFGTLIDFAFDHSVKTTTIQIVESDEWEDDDREPVARNRKIARPY